MPSFWRLPTSRASLSPKQRRSTSKFTFASLILGFGALRGLAGSHSTNLELEPRDQTSECTPYYYAPVNSHLSSFPTIWQPAIIIRGDVNAEAKWDSIKGSVPNIPPKGTPMGDFKGMNYSDTDDDCWWTFSKCVEPHLEGLPMDVSSIPEPHTLAYGFDDGPNCSHNAFYDHLVEEGQKATMFYIGSNVMDWPLEAQRAVADGHEICVHTWSHRYMTALGSRDVFAELYYTVCAMQAIKLVANVTPTCWRPPFGDVDDRVRAIAHGLGLRTILWGYDSNDWKAGLNGGVDAGAVDANYEFLINESAKGSFDTVGAVLLAHELNNFTMSEAVKYYDRLRSSFKNLVPIAVALNKTNPYVESDISFDGFDDFTSDDADSPVMGSAIVSDPSIPDLSPWSHSSNISGPVTGMPPGSQSTSGGGFSAAEDVAHQHPGPSSGSRKIRCAFGLTTGAAVLLLQTWW